MPTKQGITFQSIMSDLKKRKFYPIYLLMGEESYYIDQISNYISQNILSEDERDFNQTICFGSDVTAVQIADMARRYPMMAEYQVIIVKEAQNIKGLDAIDKYLANPVKTTILVWCYKNGKMDARRKTTALAQKVGIVFESAKLKDFQLPTFIQNYLSTKKVSIETKACQMIADHVGSDLNRLTSELNKVILSLSDEDKNITPEIIERDRSE